MGGRRVRRVTVPMVAALALGAATAGTAQAGTYDVGACGAAADGLNHTWVASTLTSPQISGLAIDCSGGTSFLRATYTSGTSLAAATPSSAPAAAATLSAQANWRFTAPAGTSIVRLDTMARCKQATPAFETWLWDGSQDPALSSCPSATTFSPMSLVPSAPVPWVEIHTRCALYNQCVATPPANYPYFDVQRATVRLREDVPPTASVTGGNVLNGWAGADANVSYTAQDTVGVKEARLLIDGAIAATMASTCDYSRAIPCPTTAAGTVAKTTAALADGAHTWQLAVVDTAGNVTTTAAASFTVVGRPSGQAATDFEENDTSAIDPNAGDDYVCHPDPAQNATYCGETPPTDPDGGGAGLAAAAAGGVTFGLADNNRYNSGGFRLFDNPSFQTLGVTRVRRTIPWNVTLDKGGQDYTDFADWVTRALADGYTPLLSLERCRSTFVRNGAPLSCEDVQPTIAEYTAGFQGILADPVLGRVTEFTAWNEPNNIDPKTPAQGGDQFYQPTRDATLTGQYWYGFWSACRARCTVAAGDFLDTRMQNATNATSFAGRYYRNYRVGMFNARPTRWAWHAYHDAEKTLEQPDSTTWWPAFRAFVRQTQSKTAGVTSPSIWLTEQGTTRRRDGKLTRVTSDPDGSDADTLRDPVPAATETTRAQQVTDRLTRNTANGLLAQSSRILRFFYYQMRGTPEFDAGLLSYPANTVRSTYNQYKCRVANGPGATC